MPALAGDWPTALDDSLRRRFERALGERCPKQQAPDCERVREPADTLASVTPWFPTAGITRVANITGLDHVGIPTVLVTRPGSRSLSVTQGKGNTLEAARASGVMEAIEHFHAEQPALPLLRGSFDELRRGRVPADVSRLPRLGRPAPSDRPLLWTAGFDLGSNQVVDVPFDLVHLDLCEGSAYSSGHFPISSNGLASGNTLLEAVAHGIWELVERDALARFYQLDAGEQWLRRLRLDSVDDPTCRDLLERYERAGILVAVWDMTSDLQLPAFYCAIVEQCVDPFRRVGKACGFGCHGLRAAALRRALTEAAQSRLTRISGSRDDIQRGDFAAIREPLVIERNQAALAAAPDAPRSFAAVPEQPSVTFEGDVLHAVRCLREVGCERVVAVDLSREPWPVSVVRMIIPGLEGHPEIPGYTPGARARGAGGSAQTAGVP